MTSFIQQVSLACLLAIGSIYGTSVGMFCIFVIYSSFQFFLIGFCCALGALLDAKTAFIATLILPSFMAIFAQGATASTFHNSYPGAVGQIISGLLIDDIDRTEWTLFGVSIAINVLIGSICFFIFMARLGNYNPLRNACNKKTENKNFTGDHEDVENSTGEVENILLEGRAIDKTYGIGEKDKAAFKALDNVTFAVEKGSLLGLVGKSGAGVSRFSLDDNFMRSSSLEQILRLIPLFCCFLPIEINAHGRIIWPNKCIKWSCLC